MINTTLYHELEQRGLEFISARDVPDFLERADEVSLPSWPEFMLHDSVANMYWSELNSQHADFQYALVEKRSSRWMAVGNSIPLFWNQPFSELPDEGWDWALRTGMESSMRPNTLCALAIQILPEFRGMGLSSMMIRIMKGLGETAGLNKLIAPVRPNQKSEYPQLSMDEYMAKTSMGFSIDPWVRTHQRLGAHILHVCHKAMHIEGSIEDWEGWTGIRFPHSGSYTIPHALNSLIINVEKDLGHYVEPNVWMVHTLERK